MWGGWLEKAPGVWGMGSLTFPLLGGPRKVYLESAYITACHNHDPKGCRNFRGASGRRDSWADPGTPQTAHKCPCGRGGRPKGVCVQASSLHPGAARPAQAGDSGRQRTDAVFPLRPNGLPLPAHPRGV